MKFISRLILFCSLISSFSCKKSTSIQEPETKNFQVMYLLGAPASRSPKREKTHENVELISVEYLHRTNLKGDFNGDGVSEILYESVLSHVTGKQIDSLVYENFPGGFYDPYTGMVVAMCDLKPSLKLKSPDGLPDLKLNHTDQVFGILDIKNLGNVNEIPGDEFAVIVDWADWSNVNTCQIYSLINDEWIRVFEFEIRIGFSDRNLLLDSIDEVMDQRASDWYYYETNSISDDLDWQKLKF